MPHITKLIIPLLFAFLLGPTAAFGAQADSLAAKLQATYEGITSMKAEFTQTLFHKESGKRESRTGVLQFKKPLLVHWETKEPFPELLVVGATEIWNVFPDEEAAYKYPLHLVEDSRSLVRVITGQSRLEQDFIFEREGHEDGLAKLRLYPKEPVQALVEAVFWVDEKSGLIQKVRIYDFYGNENEIAFTRLQTGVSLDKSVFTYTPPKDFVVEDRTAMEGVEQTPLLQ